MQAFDLFLVSSAYRHDLGTRKYSERIYDAFLEVFKTMPLAAIVDDKFFAVHAGIGPDIETIHDIDKVSEFTFLSLWVTNIPTVEPLC